MEGDWGKGQTIVLSPPPNPQWIIGNSGGGGGGPKAKMFKGKCEAKLEFPEWWGGGSP